MVRNGPMASPESRSKSAIDRRTLITGLGAAALAPFAPAASLAQGRRPLSLVAKAGSLALRTDAPVTPVWALQAGEFQFKRGDTAEIALGNELPAPLLLDWRGLDAVAAAEPLLARAPLAPGAKELIQLPLAHAGTQFCDAGLLGGGKRLPIRGWPLIVQESQGKPVGRDEIMLIEEWRVRSDGAPIAAGEDPGDSKRLYTINGQTSFELSAAANERLRLRFINGSQRTVLAIKLESHDVRVMALDGQPAEPFDARNGALVLAPGSRADVLVDTRITSQFLLHDGKDAHTVGKLAISGYVDRRAPLQPAAPLPSNGLPAQLDLRSAQRFEIVLGGPAVDWNSAEKFTISAAPSFRVKAGRPVVLALTNRAAIATVFHLHGHHFRLLDRLDDGWKPFWLDTLAVEPGQTQRIAFLAEYPGRYLIEQVATDWAAPRLVRWYEVA